MNTTTNISENMNTIRVIWQDRFYGTICMYRGFVIKENKDGWMTDMPGETDMHESEDAAKRSIDKFLDEVIENA